MVTVTIRNRCFQSVDLMPPLRRLTVDGSQEGQVSTPLQVDPRLTEARAAAARLSGSPPSRAPSGPGAMRPRSEATT